MVGKDGSKLGTKMQMAHETYRDYEVEDFLADDFFIRSHLGKDQGQTDFWQEFQALHPECAGRYQEAVALLKTFEFKEHEIPAGSEDRVWERIMDTAATPAPKLVDMKTRNRTWIWAAASVILLLGLLSWFYLDYYSEETFKTVYGERKQLILPDASRVVLNANSSIRFQKHWKKDGIREVWINGEAYLDVVHINRNGDPVRQNERFIVHMNDADVEVLGTSFMVKQRGKEGQVVLERGKVKVSVKTETLPVLMEPGDLVSFNAQTRKIGLTRLAKPERYLSWRDNQYQFDTTPLSEIIKMIHEDYGYNVKVVDPWLLNKTISGTMSSEDQAVFFKQLENAMNVVIEIQEDSTLVIRAL